MIVEFLVFQICHYKAIFGKFSTSMVLMPF